MSRGRGGKARKTPVQWLTGLNSGIYEMRGERRNQSRGAWEQGKGKFWILSNPRGGLTGLEGENVAYPVALKSGGSGISIEEKGITLGRPWR